MPKHSFLPGNRSGFTMIELALTLTVIAIMTAMMIPRFGRVMNSTRVNRTASIVAADMEQAFTLAGRYRKPMRISCDCPNSIYTIADRTGGTVRLSRRLRDADLGNMTLWETPGGGRWTFSRPGCRPPCFDSELPRATVLARLRSRQPAK